MKNQELKLYTTKQRIPLFGHGLLMGGLLKWEPQVVGTFNKDIVIGSDNRKYAIFTIAEENGNEAQWAGVYRIPVNRLMLEKPGVFDTD